jgi:hypothetical protein
VEAFPAEAARAPNVVPLVLIRTSAVPALRQSAIREWAMALERRADRHLVLDRDIAVRRIRIDR